jgi:inner membrane protein
MDSLTQITLGAAVGEVVLGKKIGNKAMLWGAIGGTIPDLDVLSNIVTDELSALAFHRAFTHSIVFSLTVPLLLGYLVYQLYSKPGGKKLAATFGSVFAAMFVLLFLGGVTMPIPALEMAKIALVVTTGILFLPFFVSISRTIRKAETLDEHPSMRAWSWLFFWSIFTHPLLDSCTTYGTQLFQPFSDFRVGLNNISVADPVYTIPFLILLIAASWFTRKHRWRSWLNYAGIIVSSIYLLFTFYHKWQVTTIFEDSLAAEKIAYERLTTTPTILNNILWQGVAEGDTLFYFGAYSFNDAVRRVDQFVPIEKNHDLLAPYAQDRGVQILSWFSKGFYSVEQNEDGSFQLSDLRFGGVTRQVGEKPQFVFQFRLVPEGEGLRFEQRPPDREMEGAFEALWERIKGI